MSREPPHGREGRAEFGGGIEGLSSRSAAAPRPAGKLRQPAMGAWTYSWQSQGGLLVETPSKLRLTEQLSRHLNLGLILLTLLATCLLAAAKLRATPKYDRIQVGMTG